MKLRDRLVAIALEWQRIYGVAPHIISSISEYDAAMLVGCSEDAYSEYMQDKTAVSRGYDFVHNGKKYQIKANRASGKQGSKITMASRATNYDWDFLIWIRYNPQFQIEEAWIWEVLEYKKQFELQKRISPADMRRGAQLA